MIPCRRKKGPWTDPGQTPGQPEPADLRPAAAGGLLGLAGWALLPEVVAIHAQQAANIGKNTILLADLALTWGFTAAFWVRPREIIYFVAACLGAFLSLSVLIINVML